MQTRPRRSTQTASTQETARSAPPTFVQQRTNTVETQRIAVRSSSKCLGTQEVRRLHTRHHEGLVRDTSNALRGRLRGSRVSTNYWDFAPRQARNNHRLAATKCKVPSYHSTRPRNSRTNTRQSPHDRQHVSTFTNKQHANTRQSRRVSRQKRFLGAVNDWESRQGSNQSSVRTTT